MLKTSFNSSDKIPFNIANPTTYEIYNKNVLIFIKYDVTHITIVSKINIYPPINYGT